MCREITTAKNALVYEKAQEMSSQQQSEIMRNVYPHGLSVIVK